MVKHLPQSSQRTSQIKKHNAKALAENRPDDVLPENSATRIWEPHEWNKELLDRQLARGEKPNIAKPPLGKGFAMLTEAPEMTDPHEEAREKANERRNPKGARKAFKGGLKVEKPD